MDNTGREGGRNGRMESALADGLNSEKKKEGEREREMVVEV